MAVRVEDATQSLTTFDFNRGQEVVYVNEERKVAVWRAPYCGPTRLHIPPFEATREELAELEGQVAARVPPNATLTVLPRGFDEESGRGTWGVFAAVDHSGPTLAGE